MVDHIETPCPLSIDPLSVRVDRNRCIMLGHVFPVLHGPTEVPAHGSLVFAMSALADLLFKSSNDHHQPLLQHVFLLFLKLCNAGQVFIISLTFMGKRGARWMGERRWTWRFVKDEEL